MGAYHMPTSSAFPSTEPTCSHIHNNHMLAVETETGTAMESRQSREVEADDALDFDTEWTKFMSEQHQPPPEDPVYASPNSSSLLNPQESSAFTKFLDTLLMGPSSPRTARRIDEELQKLNSIMESRSAEDAAYPSRQVAPQVQPPVSAEQMQQYHETLLQAQLQHRQLTQQLSQLSQLASQPPAHQPRARLPPAPLPPGHLPPNHLHASQLPPSQVPADHIPPTQLSPNQLAPLPSQVPPGHIPPPISSPYGFPPSSHYQFSQQVLMGTRLPGIPPGAAYGAAGLPYGQFPYGQEYHPSFYAEEKPKRSPPKRKASSASDETRKNHVNSEKKRRATIKNLFMRLQELVPSTDMLPKSTVLNLVYEHMKTTESENAKLRRQLEDQGVQTSSVERVLLEDSTPSASPELDKIPNDNISVATQ